MNHVQLAAPHLFEFLQEGNAVKTLAAVHQKCSERNGDEGSAARKKRNQKAGGCHHHAVGHADENVAAENRDGFYESSF